MKEDLKYWHTTDPTEPKFKLGTLLDEIMEEESIPELETRPQESDDSSSTKPLEDQ